MRLPARLFLAALAFFAIQAQIPASAQQDDYTPEAIAAVIDALPQATRERIERAPDHVLTQLVQALRKLSADDVVSPEDFARNNRIAAANDRAARIAGLMLRDVDGDGRVTEDEAGESWNRYQALLAAGADSNGDGALGLDEAIAHERVREDVRPHRDLYDIRSFDVDGDGAVALREIEAIVRAVVAAVPESRQQAIAKAVRPPKGAEACNPPERPDGAAVVLISGTWGTGVSTVALAGLDRLTTVARLVIEPGETPLYLVTRASSAVVWQVTGAVDRVVRLAVQRTDAGTDAGGGAGVIGVAADKVTFLAPDSCAEPFAWPDDHRALAAAKILAWHLTMPPDQIAIIAYHFLDFVRVPSGEARGRIPEARPGGLRIEGNAIRLDSKSGFGGSLAVRSRKPEPERKTSGLPNSRSVGESLPGSSGRIGLRSPSTEQAESQAEPQAQANWQATALGRKEQDLRHRYPDGVVKIDAKALVAPGPVEPYDVLPDTAGVLQLMREGALQELLPATRYDTGAFLLTRAIPRLPGGLASGRAAPRIVIATGVPVPKFMHENLRVYLETGECINGPSC